MRGSSVGTHGWRPSGRLELPTTFLVAVGLFLATPAFALLNGDFSSGIDSWSSSGAVSVVGGELVLSDDGPAASGAWQVVAAEASQTLLEFDVLGTLSSFTPASPFGFPDLFSASIYLFDDPVEFDPSDGLALAAISVLSIDSGGPFDVFASVVPAERGGDWLRVSLSFESPNAYFVPAFELFELAFVGGDSTVRIDDVVITPVPEPGPAMLLLIGLLGLRFEWRSSSQPRAR